MLSQADKASFRERGFVVVPGLIPEERCIDGLVAIDRLLCLRVPSWKPSGRARVSEELHDKVQELARQDRASLAVVYDAMRKVSAFWSMVGSPELTSTAGELLGTDLVGVAFRGCGIRLDLPHEDKWRSAWHQEYHSQMSSLRGVTAWFGLVGVTPAMGPVDLLVGSHREGLLPVRCDDPMNTRKDYTATFVHPDIADVVERYELASQATGPGDVVFLDFLTVHQSGWNRDERRSRVTCQVRLFDMLDDSAVRLGWKGGWQDGGDFRQAHPDKLLP